MVASYNTVRVVESGYSKTTAVMIGKPVSFGVQQRRKSLRAFRHWNRWRTICPAHARDPIVLAFTKIRIA